jgi:RNA-directed DNA polymerase
MRSCSVRSAEIQQRIRPNFAGIPSRLQAPTLSLLGAPDGVLSPLLANIALSVLDEHFTAAWAAMGDSSARHRRRRRGEATYRLVRYADDFVVLVHGTNAHAEHLHDEAAAVLAPMGLRLSDEKTRICHIDDGFDFLGFRIQRQPKRGSGKPTVYTWPTKKALCTVKAKVRAATRQRLHQPLAVLLYRLAPILRGWTSYFRHGVSKATFDYLRRFTWRRVARSARGTSAVASARRGACRAGAGSETRRPSPPRGSESGAACRQPG